MPGRVKSINQYALKSTSSKAQTWTQSWHPLSNKSFLTAPGGAVRPGNGPAISASTAGGQALPTPIAAGQGHGQPGPRPSSEGNQGHRSTAFPWKAGKQRTAMNAQAHLKRFHFYF